VVLGPCTVLQGSEPPLPSSCRAVQVAAAFDSVYVPTAAAAAAATADLDEAIGWDPGTDAAFEVHHRGFTCLQSQHSQKNLDPCTCVAGDAGLLAICRAKERGLVDEISIIFQRA
jgi:hypothetical protein